MLDSAGCKATKNVKLMWINLKTTSLRLVVVIQPELNCLSTFVAFTVFLMDSVSQPRNYHCNSGCVNQNVQLWVACHPAAALARIACLFLLLFRFCRSHCNSSHTFHTTPQQAVPRVVKGSTSGISWLSPQSDGRSGLTWLLWCGIWLVLPLAGSLLYIFCSLDV